MWRIALRNFTAKTPTYFARAHPIGAGRSAVKRLKDLAKKDPAGRARFCLHPSPKSRLQQMLIVIRKGKVIAPHRQKGRLKSFQLVEGRMAVHFYDGRGRLTQKVPMGFDRDAFIYRFRSDRWHTVVALTRFAVFVETLEGRSTKGLTEVAPWPCGRICR